MTTPKQAYSPSTWERAIAISVSVGIVGLIAYLVIRNQPFADPNLVVVTRAVLSLAIAVLGATIPGFLNVGWSGRGLMLRAGGALALFVVTFWLTPTVLPSLDDKKIPPLKNPKKIVLEQTQQKPVYRLASTKSAGSAGALSVRAVYEGDGEPQRKYFDVLISNSGAEQRILSSFKVRWLYSTGFLASIDEGTSVTPVEKYSIVIPIDPDVPDKLLENSVAVYPPLVLPPKNKSGPSVTSIRLEVLYTFEGARINWHPNADWEIFYEIRIEDDLGGGALVISRAWRRGDAPGWVEEFRKEQRRE